MPSFSELDLDPKILSSLESIGYKEPSPIQAMAIPHVLEGVDLIGLAQTGSGKTAACAIPICHKVDESRPEIQALIIVPTRELALQYATELQRIGKHKRVKAFAIFGGEDQQMQESKLRSGVQVVIATPGRLIDLIYQRVIDLTQVSTLILDEADEMLSMGFYDDLEFIFQCLVHEHQVLLFSATMPKDIAKIAKQHMKDPKEVKLTTKDAAPKTIIHKFAACSHNQRPALLAKLLKEEAPGQSIVFCQSRVQVEKVTQELKKSFRDVDFLHGGLSQQLRTVITDKFRRGRIRIMVATDVASRGLDFSGLTHVFTFQLSSDLDLYVHRSGRCGRTGRDGTAVSLVTPREMHLIEPLMKKVNREPIWIGEKPKSSGGRPAKAAASTAEGGERKRSRPPRRRQGGRGPRRQTEGGDRPTVPPASP